MGTDCDVLIVGGGMVGASLACALADQPLRVTVVEGVAFRSREQPSFDDRSIALAYGSSRIFAAMGLWQALSEATAPIRRIHISDRGHFGATRLDASRQGVDALGYVVQTRSLGQVLQERLGQLSNVELLCPARLQDLAPGDESVAVSIAGPRGPRTLNARLVVAADGAGSAVRERLNIPVTRWDYGQSAIIANVGTSEPHGGTAYERFTDTGPLAMLPLPASDEVAEGGQCSLVWTARTEQVDGIMGLDDDAFLASLQERFGPRLGVMVKVGRRHTYPLALVRTRQHTRPRVALIGNAAHALHPVAGQGFNLGIRDVAVLAELLVEAAAAGTDPGSETLLHRYEQWRRHDQRAMIAFTDGLARLFANPLPPVALARDLGLVALDLLPPLKRMLTRRTMGLAGRLPRLARGLPLS